MKKIKHAMIFMGLGALSIIMICKLMDCDSCNVDDLMHKEKKLFKNLKNKIMK